MTQLAALEAQLAILNLEGEYARTWDIGDAEGWASLFTEDGVFEMAAVGKRPLQRYEGRSALADFCRTINASYQGLHLMHVPSLSIDGTQAQGWLHFEFRARHGDELLYVAGVYKVSYRQLEGGWRMQHRLEQAVQRGPELFDGIPDSLKHT